VNIIIVKTQSDLDAISGDFKEYTQIQIHGGERYNRISVTKKWENSSVVAWENSSVVAWENSSVEAWGNSSVVAWENSSVVARENSSVVAWGNSSVVAWENSSVEAYQFALIAVLAATVVIKHLADYAVASLRGMDKKIIKKKDKTATILETPARINISFEGWLERGWVVADDIYSKLVSQKKMKGITVFTVQDWKKKKSFVVKRGEQFSHGETVDKAIESLRYKLSDRDTTRFKKWTLKTKVSAEDAIQAYRAITGACEFGVKSFCESKTIPEKLTISEVVKITSGSYGSDNFANFFKSEGV